MTDDERAGSIIILNIISRFTPDFWMIMCTPEIYRGSF